MSLSADQVSLLSRAAELRAAGTPWPETAKQLAVDETELRQLTTEHRRDYDRLARRARTEFARETLDEAMATLRRLLRGDDPKVPFLAAAILFRYEVARMRHAAKGEPKPRWINSAASLLEPLPPLEPLTGNGRAPNVSKSADVVINQGVAAAKNEAQPTAKKPVPKLTAEVIEELAREGLWTDIGRAPHATATERRSDVKNAVGKPVRSWLGDQGGSDKRV